MQNAIKNDLEKAIKVHAAEKDAEDTMQRMDSTIKALEEVMRGLCRLRVEWQRGDITATEAVSRVNKLLVL